MSGPTQVPARPPSPAAYGTITRSGRTFQTVPLAGGLVTPMRPALQPRPDESGRFGLVPFRSPLLRESLLLSSPGGTEMFQFPPFAARHLWIQCRPIRASRDQSSFDSSPGLIAVFHALRRLLAPRHPPHALSSLAALILSSVRSRRAYAATLAYFGADRFQLLAHHDAVGSNDDPLLSLRAHAESRKKLPRAGLRVRGPPRTSCS